MGEAKLRSMPRLAEPQPMTSTIKFTFERADGGPPYEAAVNINHQDQKGVAQAKAEMLHRYVQVGGFIRDNADGTTELFPMHLFKRVVVETGSVVLAGIV